MAILRSVDGKFYEIDDEKLADMEVSVEKVKEMMSAAESELPAPPEGDDEEDVEPYGSN